MVDQIAVVTFTTPAANGTFDITDASLTETFSAAVFFYSGFTADDTANAHGQIGCGLLAPDNGGAVTEEQAIGVAAEDGVDVSTDDATHNRTSACIVIPNTNPPAAADIVAVYTSTITNGVRVTFTVVGGRQAKVTAILFAGLARSAVGSLTSTVVSALENVGGTTDFEPHLVISLCSAGALNSIISNASPNLGFAVNGGSQVCAGVDADDGLTTTDADGFVLSNRVTAHIEPATRVLEDVTLSSFAANGFNHVASAGSPDWHYLALRFTGNVRVAVANFVVAGSTGLQAFNAFGFTPDIVLGMSTLLASQDALTDGATAGASGYFVTGRYASRAYTWRQQEGQALAGAPVTAASSRQGDHAVLTLTHLGVVAQQASWAGASGSGGFVLDFSTATAGLLTALGIQLVPNPPLPRPPRRRRRPARRARLRRTPQIPLGVKRAIGPIVRFWQAIARQRRKALARLRWRAPAHVLNSTPPVATVTEEPPKGRVSQPGLVRGRISGATVAEPENQ